MSYGALGGGRFGCKWKIGKSKLRLKQIVWLFNVGSFSIIITVVISSDAAMTSSCTGPIIMITIIIQLLESPIPPLHCSPRYKNSGYLEVNPGEGRAFTCVHDGSLCLSTPVTFQVLSFGMVFGFGKL